MVGARANRSNLYVAVRLTLAGVHATGSRSTCERVATFLEGLALDLREIALTRPPEVHSNGVVPPADAFADGREAKVRALLTIDPTASAELVYRVVGGRRAAVLKLIRAIQDDLKIPPKPPRLPILY